MALCATLRGVKKVSRSSIEAVARVVRRVLVDDFGNSQTAMARRLGVSQSHISHVAKGEERGPGLVLLLALRDWTGLSVDELMALPPPRKPPDVEDIEARVDAALGASIDARVETAVADALRRLSGQPATPAPPPIAPPKHKRK